MGLGPGERVVWNHFDLSIGNLLLTNDSLNIVVSWSGGSFTLSIVKTKLAHFQGLKVFLCPLKIAGKHHCISFILEVTALNELLIALFKIPCGFIVVRLEILNGIVITESPLLSRLRSLFAT